MAKSHASALPFREVLRLFALFGHPLRVVIFQRLARAPMTAGELARGLPISRPAIVQHLRRLEAARLVDASFAGRRRIYRVQPAGLTPLRRWLTRHGADARPGSRPPVHTGGGSRRLAHERCYKLDPMAAAQSRTRSLKKKP